MNMTTSTSKAQMKVTFIYHSGFVVELEHHIILFDYFKGELPVFDRNKELLVFASHFHQDHFSREVLKLKEIYPDVRYFFTKDIRRKIPKEEQTSDIVFLGKRDLYETEDLSVQTLRSTDEGSAFLVRCEGKVLYHAGDLNWWHWEEESERYNAHMRRAYRQELQALEGVPVDAAFVVLDPRQGEQYYWGFDWFMRHTDTKWAFPMHMWEKYEVCDKLMKQEESAPYRDRIKKIGRELQSFEI